MSKITLDNLSDNLKAYLEGLGLSEEQVLNLINENGLDEEELKTMLKDTMSINELSTNSKTVIGAINELFQSANNGKELIANAIGEPLDASDTFSAMSTDINSLLSTFKTNMMNNGVTVESNDRFKALIDKIATLADNEGKGIQFASGTIPKNTQFKVETNFKPNIIMITKSDSMHIGWLYNEFISTDGYVYYIADGYNISAIQTIDSDDGEYVNETGFCFDVYYGNDASYYIIGVGEEDTTLRDSLANILEEEGVDVTEEDDMASLITKVDEEFDRKNANAVSLISGTSYTLLNSSELDVYEKMNNKEVLYTHNYPGGVIKFSTLIENMGRTDSDGWYTAYDSTYLVVNHIRNGKTISSVTYRHKIKYDDSGENEVEQSVDYIVENGDKLQFLGNAPQGVAYGIQYIKLTADIQW